jgi:hypothetical protein
MLTKQVALFMFRSITDKQDRTTRLDVGPWFGGTKAADHEADAALPSQSHESQDRLAPSDLEHAKAAVLKKPDQCRCPARVSSRYRLTSPKPWLHNRITDLNAIRQIALAGRRRLMLQ